MISFENVFFSYDNKSVLSNVSFTLPRQGVVGFCGPSGCGKSTLLRLLSGLEVPQSGSVLGMDSLRIAMVFQEDRLLPWLTVQENVQLVCPDSSAEQTWATLEAVELLSEKDNYPEELSGGMQRRVALARALAYGGDMLILDEPFTGLDPALCAKIAAIIQEKFSDGLIVLVTHSADDFNLFNTTPYTLSSPISGTLF